MKTAPSGCICGIIGMRFAVPEVGVPDEAAIGRASAATQVLDDDFMGWSTWAPPPPNVPPLRNKALLKAY